MIPSSTQTTPDTVSASNPGGIGSTLVLRSRILRFSALRTLRLLARMYHVLLGDALPGWAATTPPMRRKLTAAHFRRRTAKPATCMRCPRRHTVSRRRQPSSILAATGARSATGRLLAREKPLVLSALFVISDTQAVQIIRCSISTAPISSARHGRRMVIMTSGLGKAVPIRALKSPFTALLSAIEASALRFRIMAKFCKAQFY